MMTDSLAHKYDALVGMAYDLDRPTTTMKCDGWQLSYLLGALQRGPECAVMVNEPNPFDGSIAVDIVWFRGDGK